MITLQESIIGRRWDNILLNKKLLSDGDIINI